METFCKIQRKSFGGGPNTFAILPEPRKIQVRKPAMMQRFTDEDWFRIELNQSNSFPLQPNGSFMPHSFQGGKLSNAEGEFLHHNLTVKYAVRRMKKLQASLFDDLIHHGLGLRLDVEKYLPRPPALDEVPINHFRQDHHDIFPES